MMRLAAVLMGVRLTALAFAPAAAESPLTAVTTFETYADGLGDVRGLAIDADGRVVVADRGTGVVWRVAHDHTRIPIASGLERPVGLALDPSGRVLVAEERAARVTRVEPNGARTTLISGIKQPRWLAAHEDGTLYIAARSP